MSLFSVSAAVPPNKFYMFFCQRIAGIPPLNEHNKVLKAKEKRKGFPTFQFSEFRHVSITRSIDFTSCHVSKIRPGSMVPTPWHLGIPTARQSPPRSEKWRCRCWTSCDAASAWVLFKDSRLSWGLPQLADSNMRPLGSFSDFKGFIGINLDISCRIIRSWLCRGGACGHVDTAFAWTERTDGQTDRQTDKVDYVRLNWTRFDSIWFAR